MKFGTRLWSLGVFIFLAGLISTTTGCRSKQEPSPSGLDKTPDTPVPGGMAVVALSSEPDVLNPLIRRSAVAGRVLAEILDTLTEVDEGLNNVPRIADSWELSSDRLTILYHLRPWRWQDGTALTAQDVVATFNLYKSEIIASPSRGFYRDVESARVVGENSVEYHFSRPLPDPVSRTSHQILPAAILAKLDPNQVDVWELNRSPVSSGPFRFVSWDYSRALTLERNELYSGTPALLDRVVFRIIEEPATRLFALEAGEVDFVGDIAPHEAQRIRENPDLEVMTTDGRKYYHLLWNCRNPVFEDALTRRALGMAIDRSRMIQTLLGGLAEPAVSPVARVAWNHADGMVPDPYDPNQTSSLLAEAGWKDIDGDGVLERGGYRLEFEILTKQSDPVRREGVVILRENLNRVGAQVNIKILEGAAGWELVRGGKFDAYFGAIIPNLFGDPSSTIHSDAYDQYNNGFYSNSKVDSLLEAAKGELDNEVALPLWVELQTLLQEDPPAAYLFCPQRLDGVSKRIREVRPHVLSPINNLAEWWISPEDRKYLTKRH